MSDGPRCSKCGAPITWIVTVNGKFMPLDRDPSPDGNMRLTGKYRRTERGAQPEAVVVPKAERESMFPPEGDRYMPHHATCPKAAEFRSKKTASSS